MIFEDLIIKMGPWIGLIDSKNSRIVEYDPKLDSENAYKHSIYFKNFEII